MPKIIILDRTTTAFEYAKIIQREFSIGWSLVEEKFDQVWHCYFEPTPLKTWNQIGWKDK